MPNFVNTAHAHELEQEGEINPFEVGPCALYGLHKMYAYSTATVKYKETNKIAIKLGTMYGCNCGANIVVEGRSPGSPLGKYVTDPTLVTSFLHVIYETPASNVKSTSNYSIPGYRFY